MCVCVYLLPRTAIGLVHTRYVVKVPRKDPHSPKKSVSFFSSWSILRGGFSRVRDGSTIAESSRSRQPRRSIPRGSTSRTRVSTLPLNLLRRYLYPELASRHRILHECTIQTKSNESRLCLLGMCFRRFFSSCPSLFSSSAFPITLREYPKLKTKNGKIQSLFVARMETSPSLSPCPSRRRSRAVRGLGMREDSPLKRRHKREKKGDHGRSTSAIVAANGRIVDWATRVSDDCLGRVECCPVYNRDFTFRIRVCALVRWAVGRHRSRFRPGGGGEQTARAVSPPRVSSSRNARSGRRLPG